MDRRSVQDNLATAPNGTFSMVSNPMAGLGGGYSMLDLGGILECRVVNNKISTVLRIGNNDLHGLGIHESPPTVKQHPGTPSKHPGTPSKNPGTPGRFMIPSVISTKGVVLARSQEAMPEVGGGGVYVM